jgi:hypothetical protein
MKVLLIEDDLSIVRSVVMCFELTGMWFDQKDSGLIAIEMKGG